MNNKNELIVRKKVADFLENLLEFCGYEFRHDIYKELVYSERESRIGLDELIKNYYDAFNYLLNNHKTPFSQELLKKFFYIMDCNEVESALLYRLASRFFVFNSLPIIEQALEFHLYAYQEMTEIEENKRLIVSLMFFNFILVKNEIACIQMQKRDLRNYLKYKGLFYKGEKEKILFLILELIKQSKPQPKAYYLQLRELDFKEVFHTIFKDKEILINEYSINNLYVFGSFAKNKQRLDSDIDFLVRFSEDLTYEEKCENIKKNQIIILIFSTVNLILQRWSNI